MPSVTDSFLTGANIDFLEAQYARYLADPNSVEPSWRDLFTSLAREGKPLVIDGLALPRPRSNGQTNGKHAALPAGAEAYALQGRVDQMVISHRLRGHLAATLDPLGFPRPPLEHIADAGMVSATHFTQAELDTLVDPSLSFDDSRVPLKRLLARMRNTYCRTIGVEYAHLYNSERRRWLLRRMEHCENRTEFSPEEQRQMLQKLAEAEAFEHTIHTKFQGQKRFSAEGGEVQLAMIQEFLELGGELGVKEVVFGMAHRGRLNVLANIMGKPAEEIFAEIAGPADPSKYLNRGDVKYHMGYSNDLVTRSGKRLHLTMAFNPSHLGFVHPVVEGRVRAKQDRVGGGPAARHSIVPFVIHGDSAFAGQGLVAETLNLGGLEAYDTGGTVHLIINNQIGYTTEADQGRTPLYCTGQAQMLDIPIFHVNGDDVEACVHVMRLAAEYRQTFHTDVVIDLVCYRKYGHNEGDEPRFTQPKMYQVVDQKPTSRAIYAKQLVAQGQLTEADAKQIADAALAKFTEAFTKSKGAGSTLVKDPSHLQGVWRTYVGGADRDSPQVVTGLPAERLKALLEPLAKTPEGFTLHPNVQKGVIQARQEMLADRALINWGTAEMLAYASLLTEGLNVRVSGQDTERGTFAHRQSVLHDQKTGARAFPLGAFGPGKGLVVNSPLSEMGCMAFEYGYSLDYPDALVVWEAQFGDFANNAQVLIDQFLASSEDKWKRMTGLVLLLPHGYEGAGPEHSSARLERFLELAAEDNLQVCYPTTAAQIFHLLRRQGLRTIRKPLVVMTPKSLLRLAEATCSWNELTQGTFKKLIPDPNVDVHTREVTRLLLASGKVYFDLAKQRDASKDFTVHLARLEQLYPLPEEELRALLESFTALKEVVWVQEEPKNSGAWRYMLEPLMNLVNALPSRPRLSYAGRPESASPATGFLSTHQYEQKLLVEEALTRGSNVR
ncbi:MAG: 2-oxoglutarate dehydrogenase E1 component [Myxococcaceae bacterium]|nr:2-oxoglutarate dehydrogenase E1 component [Myxococcaceae bacterium]